MMIPVRCFTCGTVVGRAWEPFNARTQAGEPAQEVMDDLGLERYCCRRMLLAHVDIVDEAARYHV